MEIQWYPGHMTKARRMMEENMVLIDIVIELVDARLPLASKNPDIDVLAKGKSRLILLNKSDLADPEQNNLWESYFKSQGFYVMQINSKNGTGMKAVNDMVTLACREKIERDRKRGIKNRPVRAMVVGIPNVGKSTFINSYAGRACTKTGNRPGVTKGKQWIRLGRNVEMLDTPGLLWPKFDDPKVGELFAVSGGIKDEITDSEELALTLIGFLVKDYPGSISGRYGTEESKDTPGILGDIAIAKHCLMKGGQGDTAKAAAMVLDDFRSGKLGRITLESVPA